MGPGWISTAVKAPVHAEIKQIAARQNAPMSLVIQRAITLYCESGMEAIDARINRTTKAAKEDAVAGVDAEEAV